MAKIQADPYIGRVLADKYLLVRRIAAGGTGVVYLATSLTAGGRFAVKLPFWRTSKGLSVVQARDLQREVRAHRQLSDVETVVNLVEADVDVNSKDPFMVFEFVPGMSLREWMAKQHGRVDPRSALMILADIAEAAAAAHAIGVRHGDLKPPNVLMPTDQDGNLISGARLQVTDFGLSTHGSEPYGPDANSGLPKFGITSEPYYVDPTNVPGTDVYMAPEMRFTGRRITFAADTYALGLIGLELLDGTNPLMPRSGPQPTHHEIVAWHMTKAGKLAEYSRERWSALSNSQMAHEQRLASFVHSNIPDLIGRMTEHDPEKRIAMNEVPELARQMAAVLSRGQIPTFPLGGNTPAPALATDTSILR